jgi:serine/threonine protein kinase
MATGEPEMMKTSLTQSFERQQEILAEGISISQALVLPVKSVLRGDPIAQQSGQDEQAFVRRHLPEIKGGFFFSSNGIKRSAITMEYFSDAAHESALAKSPTWIQKHPEHREDKGRFIYQTLKEMIRNARDLNVDRIINILFGLSEIIDWLHRHDTQHLDLKSKNVLINDIDQTKLLDFGSSNITVSSQYLSFLESHGENVGSIPYLSPETLEPRQLTPDERKYQDLFALGVIAFELLFGGVQPFWFRNKETLERNFYRQEDKEGVVRFGLNYDQDDWYRWLMSLPMRTVGSEEDPLETENLPSYPSFIPPQIGAVFAKIFSREPQQRYQSAEAFVEALAMAHTEAMREGQELSVPQRNQVVGFFSPITSS